MSDPSLFDFDQPTDGEGAHGLDLERLNPDQLDAVVHRGGPLLEVVSDLGLVESDVLADFLAQVSLDQTRVLKLDVLRGCLH